MALHSTVIERGGLSVEVKIHVDVTATATEPNITIDQIRAWAFEFCNRVVNEAVEKIAEKKGLLIAHHPTGRQ